MKHLARPHGRTKRGATIQETQAILRHWREAVPNDRLAHLVKDAARALLRALQLRLTAHGVSLGHWTFLRILWEKDGITQRELSEQAGVMEPTTTSALKRDGTSRLCGPPENAGKQEKGLCFPDSARAPVEGQAGTLRGAGQ